MPVDADGNRADLIMDPDSRLKRMNLGGVYEQGINAASRDVTRELRRRGGIDPYLERNVEDIEKRREIVNGVLAKHHNENSQVIRQLWDYYLEYVVTVSQKMFDVITQEYKLPPENLLSEVLADGIRLWMPIDNPTYLPEAVREIREKFPIVFGPVSYHGGVQSSLPVLIGSVYIILLEKTGSDFSAASSAKLQHFGIPSKVSGMDKHSAPGRNNPVRILGESEVRLLNAVVGSDVVADLVDMSNNPATHKEIIRRIHESPTPSNFTRIIDRKKLPLGNSRPLLLVKHILQCAGIEFTRVVKDPYRLEQMRQAEEELERYIEAEKNGDLSV